MTHNDFISLVQKPGLVNAEHVGVLKEMVDLYPYFVPARMFYAKSLQMSDSVLFADNLKSAALYSLDRRWLYYYIYPERKTSAEPYRRERTGKSSGDYFDMLNVVESEGGDKQTLKNLAERLRNARNMVSPSNSNVSDKSQQLVEKSKKSRVKESAISPIIARNEKTGVDNMEYADLDLEQTAKKLIKERKYLEAIEILRELNLNNPKKSIYFADQIRFLEKIIVNSK